MVGMIQLINLMEQELVQRGVTIITSSPVETVADQGTGLVFTMRKKCTGPTTYNKIYADRAILALSPQLVTQLTFEPPLDQDRMALGSSIPSQEKPLKSFCPLILPFGYNQEMLRTMPPRLPLPMVPYTICFIRRWAIHPHLSDSLQEPQPKTVSPYRTKIFDCASCIRFRPCTKSKMYHSASLPNGGDWKSSREDAMREYVLPMDPWFD